MRPVSPPGSIRRLGSWHRGLDGFVVDPRDLGEHRERIAESSGEMLERTQILGEAVSSVAKSRPEEFWSDPRIRAHHAGNGFDIGAGCLAEIRASALT